MIDKKWLDKEVENYYGRKLNIVQIFKDPKVDGCYVIRVEEKGENWCFVINTSIGETMDDFMIDDQIDLKIGQKITRKMFGALRF